ncbi:uncharacterized protein [Diabrotica undecimpunctata]|uniref:uncharacterized protein n=1 Tax=Diabrotica undecimpunctata TaxID=50387 RepID=UPI003B633D17
MNYFSKWPEIAPLPNQEATTVAETFITNVIPRHGVLLELHSYQGRNSEPKLWLELMKILAIKKTCITPFYSQSDEMVERHNTFQWQYYSMFFADNHIDWDTLIHLFLLTYRSYEHEPTSNSPSMMITGRGMKLPKDLIFGRLPSC